MQFNFLCNLDTLQQFQKHYDFQVRPKSRLCMQMFWLLGFFLQKEKYWLGQHHLSVWTLWTLLSLPRYYIFLHLTLETQLCSETWNSQVENPRVQPAPRAHIPVPKSRLGSLSAPVPPRERQGHSLGKHHLPFQQPERAKPSTLLFNQAPFGSLVSQQFTVSWGSPQDGECQSGNTRGTLQPSSSTRVTWAQPPRLPGADTPNLPHCSLQLEISCSYLPECSLTCQWRAAGPLLSTGICLHWQLYKGWVQ